MYFGLGLGLGCIGNDKDTTLMYWKIGHRATTDPADAIEVMYSNTRSNAFGEEVKRRILLGTFTLSRRLVGPLTAVMTVKSCVSSQTNKQT